MNRRLAREIIMQIFYQMDIHNSYEDKISEKFIEGILESHKDVDIVYIRRMIEIIKENIEAINEAINNNLDNWKMDRISKIDLSILRVATVELLFMNDIPLNVSINEAIELGKKFGTDNSPSFINGILGSLANSKGKDNE